MMALIYIYFAILYYKLMQHYNLKVAWDVTIRKG